MPRTEYADEYLVRLGWIEVLRNSRNELVAVPSIPSHQAVEYLHVAVDGNRVIITVERRTPTN